MDAVVDVRRLEKRYGREAVLRDVSFSVPRGCLATLTGRSGSGKSTLFKLLAGLDRPTSGEVLVDGVDLARLSDDEASDLRLRRIGIVFQAANLLPDLDVLENVRLPLDIAGVPRREAAGRAREALDLVQAGHLADRMPARLSGGEQQRVAIARALANQPALLLADEPTGSLDAASAEAVVRLFEDVNARLGTTVLVVSHDPIAIERIQARLALEDGRVRWARLPAAGAPTPGAR